MEDGRNNMTDLTERIDAIQTRLDAATPGPWMHGGMDSLHSKYEVARWVTTADVGDTICDMDGLARSQNERHAKDDGGADAEFIAAAPSDVAFLLDLARKQAAALEAVRGLHKPVSIYECDDNGFPQTEDESKFVRDICGVCSDSSVTEDLDDGNYDIAGSWGEVTWPCDTIAALEAKP